MANSEQVTFHDVLNAEVAEIHRRRIAARIGGDQAAALATADPESLAASGAKRPATVGLAISGGGIRSACVGLGLLQSLYRRGILRHVDYLSTVSGGGYVGAYLSSFLATCKGKIDWTPGNPDTRDATKLPFHAEAGAPQAASVLRMANRGEVMKEPIKFLSRHLWGLITVNLFVFSGLIALGAVAAYLFRMLDAPTNVLFLKQLGFQDDVGRAFFPAFVMFLTWLFCISVAGVLRQRRLKIPPFSSVMYFLFVLTSVMGFVTLLATKNVETKYFENVWGMSLEVSNGIRSVLNFLSQGLLVIFAVGVAPYLNISAVIRSGTNPKSRLESWVFNLASSALLFGSPLVVFFVLSREDISGWNLSRPSPNTMSRTTIKDWPEFWRLVGEPHNSKKFQGEKNIVLLDANATPSDVIWMWLEDTELPSDYRQSTNTLDELGKNNDGTPGGLWNSTSTQFARGNKMHPVAKCVLLAESNKREDKTISTWHRWLQALANAVQMDDKFVRRWNDDKRLSEWKDAIINELNEDVLSDPSFYLCFANSSMSEPFRPQATARVSVLTEALLPGYKQAAVLPKVEVAGATNGTRSEAIKSQGVERFRAAIQFSGLALTSGDTQRAAKTVKATDDAWSNFKPAIQEVPVQLLSGIEERSAVIQVLIQHCRDLQKDILRQYGEQLEYWANQPKKDRPELWKEIIGDTTDIAPLRNDLTKLWRGLVKSLTLTKEVEDKLARESVIASPEDRIASQPNLTAAKYQRQKLEDLMNHVQRLNWNLLQAYFGKDLVYPQTEVFALVVNGHDQSLRLWVFGCSGLMFVVLGLLFSVNPTMLHGFYRDQLAALWLHPNPQHGLAVPLHELKNCELGGPLPLLHGTLNLYGPRRDHELDAAVRFTFSPLHVGAKRVGYSPSDQYMRGSCDLADAMAISGAAISPTATENILVRALLVLFNFRLGQWLHHPRRPPGDLAWPSPLRLLWGYLMVEPPLRDYLFVSDGGHTENTGIAALLQRRCRLIIACDSSQDGGYEFADLRKLLIEGDNKYGVRFWTTGKESRPVRLDDLVPDEKTKLANKHFVVLRIEYPVDNVTRLATLSSQPDAKEGEPQRTGYLIYIKPNLTGDESAQLLKFKLNHTAFPHDPTLDQFFEPNRFLAYRELGEHLGDDVCQQLFSGESLDRATDFPWLASTWVPDTDLPPKPTSDPQFGLHSLPDGPLTPENIETVFAMLKSTDPDFRQVACAFLSEYGPLADADIKGRTVDVLVKALAEEKATAVRIDLCNTLSLVGEDDPKVIQVLQGMAEDEHEATAVRTVCELLVKELSKSSFAV